MKLKIIILFCAVHMMNAATFCYGYTESNKNLSKDFLKNLAWNNATPELLMYYTDAISYVESKDNPNVLPGDNGNAIGQFQIWKIMVREVNRVNEKYKILVKCNGEIERYKYNDRQCPRMSREMCAIYLVYCTKYRGLTFLQACRCWNGGHNGYRLNSTLKYQNDIIKFIESH